MKISIKTNTILTNPILYLFIWGIIVVAYVIAFQYDLFTKELDYFVYILQLMADVSIALFSYLAFKTKLEKITKKFYFLILLSLIPGLFANEIYNVLVNLFQINRYGNSSLYWTIAYALFLLIQTYAWVYLIYNKKRKNNEQQKWLTSYSYLISATVIFLSLFFILIINDNPSQKININGLINSLLEIFLFSLISMSLSRTKNNSLVYVATGFLLLIGFNFVHRFSNVLSVYYKVFDVVWLSCLLIIIYGLYTSYKRKRDKIKFFKENSIHVLTCGAFILFANFIMIVFTISIFGLGLLQIDKVPNFKLLMLDVPSAFMFAYSLTLLLAKFLSLQLSSPLENIVKRIGEIATNNNYLQQEDQKHIFKINEVEVFKSFIIKTISALQHANNTKSQFLMNMSHDFRTPASGILYMSKLVHDRMLDDEIKPLQKMIINSSEQLMKFLDEVLDYSILENNKLNLNKEYFDVVALIDELAILISAKVSESGLTIQINHYKNKIMYFSDKFLIQAVILNLLSNAIKFTHTGGINISTLIEIIENKKWLVIKIKDTGIGIEKIYYKKIFEPFYKIESVLCVKNTGVGLGLSNVDLILKKLNSHVKVESEVGAGSEFILYFPL